MRGSCALLFLLGACRAAPVSTPEPSAFNAPWEGLEETDQLTGACTTDVGTADQGAGWFHAAVEDVWGVEGCWVRVVRPDGASEDLVIATLAGRDRPDK